MSEKLEDLDRVAVVGMAGRFPGASDLETFWRNLEQVRETISSLSREELGEPGLLGQDVDAEGYVDAKGLLEDGDRFDAGFFGYSPREAELMDPQQRVFLEVAWEALESAGRVPNEFPGRIGVFAGSGPNTYLLNNLLSDARILRSAGTYQMLLGNDKDFLATRVAYKFGLRGPAVTVQSACSTSLTALHLACQSLLSGECDLALVGGVCVSSPLRGGYAFEPGGILSADGHCRPFDAAAGGTVPGNGVGVVVLRRLDDALLDGDTVDAVVLATAINNDGSHKVGYTAPSVDGQSSVIVEALEMAGVEVETIGYVETHGTGTVLGDPIEITALSRAFGRYTKRKGFCRIGSVKANIGHLDAAAGVTALIKTVLMLKHGVVPGTPNFTTANPGLDLDSTPFLIDSRTHPWPRGNTPRRAGVSSFGIGGTNVHVVLEEAPAPCRLEQPDGLGAHGARHGGLGATDPGATDPGPLVLPLSAVDDPALLRAAARLANHWEENPRTDLADVVHTLLHRRRSFGHRATMVCSDREEAISGLRRLRESDISTVPDRPVRVAFLFPGQGAQYVDMTRDLYENEPVFAEELDRCADLFTRITGNDPRLPLFVSPDVAASSTALQRTETAQPVLFSVEYALARLLEVRGIRSDVMIGHSIGEYVAACLAGVFDLQDAVRLVAARGRLVQAMPTGSMLTVFLPEHQVQGLLAEIGGNRLTVAAVNSTELTVVSGPTDAIEALERRLEVDGTPCRRLHTSHAFHSRSMDGAVAGLVEQVRQVRANPPTVPFHSNVTGTLITAEQATDPEYWGEHLREPVRFSDAVRELLGDESLVFVEVGPGNSLSEFVRQHRDFTPERTVVSCLRHARQEEDDRIQLHRALGTLWAAGACSDTTRFSGPTTGRAVRLPNYPFERQRFWIDPTGRPRDLSPSAVEDGPAARIDDWFYTPGWKRLSPIPAVGPGDGADEGPAVWAVLCDESGLGEQLLQGLRDRGAAAVGVRAAEVLSPDEDGSWTVDPCHREHWARLVEHLARLVEHQQEQGTGTLRLVHLLSLDHVPNNAQNGTTDLDRVRSARRKGFDSLLALAQGLADVRPSALVDIDVLCRGVLGVTGEELLQPENATLTGVCTVVPQELDRVGCRLLDISGTDPAAPRPGAVDLLLDVLHRPTPERELALRGRCWWRRDFDATPLPAPTGPPSGLRDGGVYLITGGFGGVGLALAEHLARTVDSPVLALMGRSPLPSGEERDRLPALRGLEELGARVVVLTGDVTDAPFVTGAVDDLRERFGALHGVVHAAGRPGTGMMATKSASDVDDVFAAKVTGTLVLEAACSECDLDFFLLCSSVTSLLGGPGQSDYCAANAFLNAFAEDRSRAGAPVTAVAWGTWEGVGMAASLGALRGGGRRRQSPVAEDLGHPLLRRVSQGPDLSTFRARVSTADTWIVDDHRLMGHGLIPGTAHLELVRAALAERAAGRSIELRDVLFLTPVIVPDGQSRTVHLTIEGSGAELAFTVRSLAADGRTWREHACGTAVFVPAPRQEPKDLAALVEQCDVTDVLNTEEQIRRAFRTDRFARGAGSLEFEFGPRWEIIREIRTGARRMVATMSLGEEFAGDLEDYPLHPALLDLAGGIFRIHARDPYYLPLTYRTLRVHGALTSTVHCHVSIEESIDLAGETLTCDFELLDPEGRVLVEVEDFTVKRINDVPALLGQIEVAREDARAEADRERADRERADRSGTEAIEPPDTRSAALPVGPLQALSEGLTRAQGQEAFGRLLSAPTPDGQIVVSPREFTSLRALARSITPALLAEELSNLETTGHRHPRPDLDTPYVEPSTPEQKEIAAVWQEILGLERIGIDDDFFALGGHSLAAVRIGTKLRSRFGVELDLQTFFRAPTVAGTAALLATGKNDDPDDVIEAVGRHTPEELPDVAELSDDEVDVLLRELISEETTDDAL
ncbi:MAG: phthiocerol/phenolphthiocerol synthesis type-I polyketide synthase [Actinomycetota bacterium]|nr:phthiocerol/phenolphthiocerol synthesis type-I polyketide synthase [Actinomycetota bacterium]